MAKLEDELKTLFRPTLESLGYQLWGLEYIGQGKHSVLRLYIDRPEGIFVEDCAQVSRQIGAILDVEDPINSEYTLEVSSPGLDRPLFDYEHFVSVVGKTVKLRLGSPIEGNRRKYKGKLISTDEKNLIIEDDGVEYSIEFANIEKANLVAEW